MTTIEFDYFSKEHKLVKQEVEDLVKKHFSEYHIEPAMGAISFGPRNGKFRHSAGIFQHCRQRIGQLYDGISDQIYTIESVESLNDKLKELKMTWVLER